MTYSRCSGGEEKARGTECPKGGGVGKKAVRIVGYYKKKSGIGNSKLHVTSSSVFEPLVPELVSPVAKHIPAPLLTSL